MIIKFTQIAAETGTSWLLKDDGEISKLIVKQHKSGHGWWAKGAEARECHDIGTRSVIVVHGSSYKSIGFIGGLCMFSPHLGGFSPGTPGFLPYSEDMHVSLPGDFKLAIIVK